MVGIELRSSRAERPEVRRWYGTSQKKNGDEIRSGFGRQNIMKSNFPLSLKEKIYNQCILLVIRR